MYNRDLHIMNPHFNNTQGFFTAHNEIVDTTEMRITHFDESAQVHCRDSRELQESYIEVIFIPPGPIMQTQDVFPFINDWAISSTMPRFKYLSYHGARY